MRWLFALLTLTRLVVGIEYDEGLSRNKFFPLAAAAYSNKPEECLENKVIGTKVLGKYVAPCNLRKSDHCFSFIGVNHKDKALILSFRGSTTPEQIVHEVLDTIVKPEVQTFNDTKVGFYFYHAFDQMWNKDMKVDFERYQAKFRTYDIWVTGHSLGGAMASLCAATIAFDYPKASERVVLYTFGEPRVGDKKYADLLDNHIPNSFRVIHNRDVVVNIPIIHAGHFWHHNTAVFYKNDMQNATDYIECSGPDRDCTFKHMRFQTSIEDHLNYFGMRISDYGLNSCKPVAARTYGTPRNLTDMAN
uniref:Lipase_3 domain-containing protein n=2 Tax=Bursaphelenchus xylophilus TaxID=6326 RepID=A0A1I7S5H6_BURXY